jgi:hypothetical protein
MVHAEQQVSREVSEGVSSPVNVRRRSSKSIQTGDASCTGHGACVLDMQLLPALGEGLPACFSSLDACGKVVIWKWDSSQAE